MSFHDHTATESCYECPMTEHCCTAAQPSNAGLRGWSFAWSSVGVFLVPLALAVTGALIGQGSDTRRFLFGSAGLLLGMLVSTATYRIFSHSSKKDMDS